MRLFQRQSHGEDLKAMAHRVLDDPKAGLNISHEQITWALIITGDLTVNHTEVTTVDGMHPNCSKPIKSNTGKWTRKEIEILRKIYPENGIRATLEMLPSRTRSATQTKLRKLKIYVINPRSIVSEKRKGVWSKEEIKIMIDHYPYIGASGVKQLMPKRTEGAITRKAYSMRLKRPKSYEQICSDEDLEAFTMPVTQIWRPVGTWKAERPLVRSVFELGGAM
jgi:hypothetical protein